MKFLAVDVSALFSLYWHAAQGTAQEFSEPYLDDQTVRRHREGFDRVAICCDTGTSFPACNLAELQGESARTAASRTASRSVGRSMRSAGRLHDISGAAASCPPRPWRRAMYLGSR